MTSLRSGTDAMHIAPEGREMFVNNSEVSVHDQDKTNVVSQKYQELRAEVAPHTSERMSVSHSKRSEVDQSQWTLEALTSWRHG